MIPHILVRTVPSVSPAHAEELWDKARTLHPDWRHITYRDPLDTALFPLTAPSWPLCRSGAQLAGLVRLEALWTHGGIYLDSDLEVFRPLDPLLSCSGFGLWEDETVVPDFVLGARSRHPAIGECLALALERLRSTSTDWRTGPGSWSTGPGVTTTVLPGRNDFLLLPPHSFAPYHYSEPHRAGESFEAVPYVFGAHRWAHSWAGS